MMRISVLVVLVGMLSMPKPGLGDEPITRRIPPADKLTELKKEWEKNFAHCAKLIETQYEAGTIDFDRFCKIKAFLLKTNLEMTEKPDERIAVLEEHLKIAENLFEFVERRHKCGVLTESDLRKSKTALLSIKILLAKEASEKNTSVTQELEKLQKEQLENLSSWEKVLTIQYEMGTISIEQSAQAKEMLYQAKLDSTTKSAERIALLEENLKYFRSFFESVEKRRHGGAITEGDLLQAKALYQTVEIYLAKEQADGKNPSLPAKLGDLEKSRVDTLSELVKSTRSQFEAGNGDIDQLLRFQQELLCAKLDSTEKHAERITVLEEQFKDSKNLSSYVEHKFKSGILTENDCCQAKAAMIALDYRLAKERMKDEKA
jgi:hypothetical protein